MMQQGTKGAGADIVGTDQPQPIDPLRVAELRYVLGLIVHAAPVRGIVAQLLDGDKVAKQELFATDFRQGRGGSRNAR
jgi:hypothetical protein